MPPRREPLAESSGNRRRGPNLTPDERLRIIAKRECGCAIKELAEEFGRSKRAIKYTIRTYANAATTQERPRSGRVPILSARTKKLIYRKARSTPKIDYAELAKVAQVYSPNGTLSKPPSKSTLYRALKQCGITNHPCKVRPKLTHARAVRRVRFSRKYRNYNWLRQPIKFSDECSIQKGAGHTQEWCFRYDDEKWDQRMITEIPTGRRAAQMVWACIWLDERGRPRRSKLVIMERDPDAAHNGYSAQSYIKTLRKGLLPHYQRSQLFMQDNASIHTARAVRAFLAEHGITTINWPPYSPDLNPIEHLWWVLKKLVYKHYPQYNNFSRAEKEWEGFCEALKRCWRMIPGRLIKALIMSMPRRLAACRKAKGWQTKY